MEVAPVHIIMPEMDLSVGEEVHGVVLVDIVQYAFQEM